jgi:hypothetical protein
MEELQKKMGGTITTFIVMILLAFSVSYCQKYAEEHKMKARMAASKSAASQILPKQFILKPGERASVYTGYSRFILRHSKPIRVVAMVGEIESSKWMTLYPQVETYIADREDTESVVIENINTEDVKVSFSIR